jgi:hypothetical protein
LRDDYEYVYRHYPHKGIELPLQKSRDSIDQKLHEAFCTSVRAEIKKDRNSKLLSKTSLIGYIAGAGIIHLHYSCLMQLLLGQATLFS